MQKAIANLQKSLARVRAIVAEVDANAQAALKDSSVQARHETTLCASTVILSGFLESFLREIAEEMIGEICRAALPFDQLPSKIRVAHYWDGATALREIARTEKNDDPLVLSRAADAARRLASVGALASPYELLWEAFADTQANPGPDQISAFLKRFDISDPLPSLATEMNTTQNTLSLRLRSFMKIRNECAHTGSASQIPTSTDVASYCDLIDGLGTAINATLQSALARPPYVPVPSAQISVP